MSSGCDDCGGVQVTASNLPGFVACRNCGKLRPGSVATVPEPEKNPYAEYAMNAPLSLEIPDSTEVVSGWRAWGIKIDRPFGQPPLMWSVTHREAHWTPREPMRAVCPRSTGRANGVKRQGHEVPDEDCSCGLYSAKSREHLLSMGYHSYDAEATGMFTVIGEVALWGKVIEGGQGWRAAIGYPRELYLPYEAWGLAADLERMYGVPVQLNNFLR